MEVPATGPSMPIGSAVDAQHPWLGLASFTEETRGYFYGREEEISELTRRVQRKLLTVLFGQSGLGKTSILNAGVVPRLRQDGYCPVYVRVDYSAAAPAPAEQIKQAVFRATRAAGSWTQPGSAVEGESLWEFFHHRDDALRDADGEPVIPLLIFDQFEEIFTLAQADDAGRARAAAFIDDLADLVENRPPEALEARIDSDDTLAERYDFARADYRVLIALREDYLAHLESLKASMPSITQNRMRLARMTGEQALEAVVKPGGRLVTPEVAESIVRFVAGGSELRNAEVEPSLLSLICRELNNARIAQGKDTISIDVLAGSNATILGEFYERALADQPAALRKVIEDELLTDSGYRENIAEERVLKAFTAAGAQPDAQTALATLVNRRLLRIEERLDVRRVELTHDVLCSVVQASRAERLEREAREEAERKLAAQRDHERATRAALLRARKIAVGCAALAVLAVAGAAYGIYSAKRTEKAEQVAQRSRDEAERLVDYILDDFYNEMEPIGRADVLAGLAKRAVDYYDGLPPEAQNASTQRNGALARAQYSRVLSTAGKDAEADRYLDAAAGQIAALRERGDRSEPTAIAAARVAQLEATRAAGRIEMRTSAKLAEGGLADLGPITRRPDAPTTARITEAALTVTLGYAQLRNLDLAAATKTLRRAIGLQRALGSSELRNLTATSNHVRASWILEEAARQTLGLEERRAILMEGLGLADRLLAVRPGHRPALRARSSTLRGLSDLALESLQGRQALDFAMRSEANDRASLELDAGIGVSRNNLRIGGRDSGRVLWFMGRVDDSRRAYERALEVGPGESVDTFGSFNLTTIAYDLESLCSELGDRRCATVARAEGERYLAQVRKDGSPEIIELLESLTAVFKGLTALSLRDSASLGEARRRLDRSVIALSAGGVLRGGYLGFALPARAEIAWLMGDDAVAEGDARRTLQVFQEPRYVQPSDRLMAMRVRAVLALSLARQGKKEEALRELQPALEYHRSPMAKASDLESLKAEHAFVLYAAALSTSDPSKRRAYLVEAAQRFDSMVEPLRRARSYAALRADIARALQG